MQNTICENQLNIEVKEKDYELLANYLLNEYQELDTEKFGLNLITHFTRVDDLPTNEWNEKLIQINFQTNQQPPIDFYNQILDLNIEWLELKAYYYNPSLEFSWTYNWIETPDDWSEFVLYYSHHLWIEVIEWVLPEAIDVLDQSERISPEEAIDDLLDEQNDNSFAVTNEIKEIVDKFNL